MSKIAEQPNKPVSLPIRITAWTAWVQGDEVTEKGGFRTSPDIEKSAIPAALRRRLNTNGKACAAEALRHLSAETAMPVVYCSRHGDIERTLRVLTDLAAGEPVSPMHFSLAVHNAISGVLSIHLKQKTNISAISGGKSGLVPTLLEAQGILLDGEENVLCIINDITLPEIYIDEESKRLPHQVVCFVLSRSQGKQFLLSTEQLNSDEISPELDAASFIAFLESNSNEAFLSNHHGQGWALIRQADEHAS